MQKYRYPNYAPSSESSVDERREVFMPTRPAMPRILIVEDEPMLAMMIEDSLKEQGYIVVGSAVEGLDAVAMAVAHKPDLVVMDIRLANGSDGIAAAIEIRRRTGTRSLFASAHSDARTVQRGQAADPAGWLAKPYSNEKLMAAVKNALTAVAAKYSHTAAVGNRPRGATPTQFSRT
jgi:CheY-like chemotaxis protein